MQMSSSPAPALSLLTPMGYQSSDCGYCKATGSSQRTPDARASYYVSAKTLTPVHYQELLDRGWRRSGTLLYLPDAHRSCCPHYTIRLLAADFAPTRDQRQALNRWNRFVLGETYLQARSAQYPKSKAEKKHCQTTFDLLPTVHESEKASLHAGLQSEHTFVVELEKDDFSEEKYALFAHYQKHVHHEGDGEVSKAGFRRFLCDSPLIRQTGEDDQDFGSFHQCYRFDGRLIAMAVLDLLPHAVSGVYFIYHTDFEKCSLGKLSALREAALALERGYRYYYMGYYIHSCKKMRYKADYRPQHVLDFVTHEWHLLDDKVKDLMERREFATMSRARRQEIIVTRGRALPDESANPHDGGIHDTNASTDDDDDAFQFSSPAEAKRSGLSLLQLGMPGVMAVPDLLEQVDLDSMSISLGRRGTHEMQDLQAWHTSSELDARSLKGHIAEYAAAVGPVVAREAVVGF